ncbi:MAG TPA: hypothetical protein VK917_03955, partial [Ilumatobacter sp.]|nr:hypothetical protein [Ilumatobacter sp.]
MLGRDRTVSRRWPDDDDHRRIVLAPRDDLVSEDRVGAGPDDDPQRFVQRHGPFAGYERVVTSRDGRLDESTTYRLTIPWFAWLFALPVRWAIARKGTIHRTTPPWWAPPDQIDARQGLVLGLLAAASMSSAFTNTLFTQTAQFAADDFGVGDTGFGNAMSVVRAGIVVVLPLAVLADRIGRQRVMRAVA